MAATISCNLMTLFFFLFLTSTSHAQLSSTFYSTTCPVALSTIKSAIVQAVAADRRMAASLIRLHFHDCFVQGCDASVLLDEQASATSERDALQNRGSLRGFNVIESAKASLETLCPGVVSCADILAVAARDASVEVSGPSWTVKLGRRDSTTASKSQAESDLPLVTSTLQEHISNFASKGLNQRDLVALSGSHTIGQAQCLTFRDRIYNTASDIDAGFASTRQSTCPATANSGDSNLAPLDLVTPNVFDNTYFRNLIEKKGLLQSDQILLSGGSTDSIVQEYDTNGATFRADFANAMVKMGDIDPLTGQNGVIRTVCSSLN